MALQALHQGANLTSKRKHPGDTLEAITSKRLRNDSSSDPNNLPSTTTTSLSAQPLQSLISDLSPKYNIKTLSVISSTSISKRIDSVLAHLGRISAWDSTVLPGVVLLYARSASTNKLITIAETVRRRIHEAGQKWYQYNLLYEMEWAAGKQQQQQKPQRENRMETMVEDTVMSMDGEGEGDAKREEEEEEDDFEVMATPQTQTVFERAVHGKEKVRQMAHMSIFLSRIPIPELKVRENFAVQSNEEYINHVQRKRAGLAA
ncbi:hypothetical protein GE09DRAFT_316643 [Coniochaeta sp. 2T2.1]|nr:hypothetical protein GE09DRAFT_316643 [Coniochaeta sp. 2T2.1]